LRSRISRAVSLPSKTGIYRHPSPEGQAHRAPGGQVPDGEELKGGLPQAQEFNGALVSYLDARGLYQRSILDLISSVGQVNARP
jgi:hypothetical protein